MIGKLNLSDRRVTIIGAGFSGLLAAYELDRRGFEVTLYEKQNRAGGLIRTLQTDYGMTETAAHSFLATDEVRALCQDLGVELIGVQAKERYILRDGRLRKFPLKIREALVAFFRAYFVLSRESESLGRATVADWGRRHLGAAVVQYLLSPFLTGVYAVRPSELALGAAFPGLQIPRGQSFLSQQLFLFRQRLFSKSKKSPRPMMAPKNGMGSLVEALERRLSERLGDRFKKGVALEKLPENVGNLILSTPAPEASRLLAAHDIELSRALSSVSYAPLIAVSVIVEKKKLKRVPVGVGVLMPESEKRNVLGVLFDSSSFSGRARNQERDTALTLMMGGTFHPEILELEDSAIKKLVRQELAFLFGLPLDSSGDPWEVTITRWEKAIPIYNSALMEAWDAARKGWCSQEGRILFGNYSGEVSLRGMIQAISGI